jgi:hypothetical protein
VAGPLASSDLYRARFDLRGVEKGRAFAEIAVKNNPDVNEELSNLFLMKVIQDRRCAWTSTELPAPKYEH